MKHLLKNLLLLLLFKIVWLHHVDSGEYFYLFFFGGGGVALLSAGRNVKNKPVDLPWMCGMFIMSETSTFYLDVCHVEGVSGG